MKVLVSSFGAHGHLLPLLPLARAAQEAGDSVVVATSEDVADATEGLSFVPTGPLVGEMFAENVSRTGIDPTAADSPRVRRASYELFTRTRIDMTLDAMRAVVRSHAPEVLLAEEWDYLAPVVAAEAGIPWFPVNHSPRTIADVALEASAEEAYRQLGLTTAAPCGRVQIWPQWLQGYGYVPFGDEVDVRPSAHRGAADAILDFGFPDRRPLVLVTMGTAIVDAELCVTAIDAAVDAGANVVATRSAAVSADALGGDRDRLRVLPFTPLDDVFRAGVDLVLTVGGSGTALAALSHGVPLVIMPQNYNQPVVADLVANFGAGLTCRRSDRIGAALEAVFADEEIRAKAQEARDRFQRIAAPRDAWTAVKDRVAAASDSSAKIRA